MKHHFSPAIARFTIGLWALLCAAGCASNPPDSPVMPPSTPRETIQSSIYPSKPTPLPPPSVPKGIQLFLEGDAVTFETLSPHPAHLPPKEVQVEVDPMTRYSEVERVLEQLHNLGYLIDFQPRQTP